MLDRPSAARLRTPTDKLDHPLARIELPAQPLAEFALACGKIILGDWVESECANRGGHVLASGSQFLADRREKQAWSVHAASASSSWLQEG